MIKENRVGGREEGFWIEFLGILMLADLVKGIVKEWLVRCVGSWFL